MEKNSTKSEAAVPQYVCSTLCYSQHCGCCGTDTVPKLSMRTRMQRHSLIKPKSLSLFRTREQLRALLLSVILLFGNVRFTVSLPLSLSFQLPLPDSD